MTSVVQIGNLALAHIGEFRITSLTDESKQARLINEHYETVRDAVLRAHPWNCAIARTALAALATGPAWGAQYAFQLPVACLRVLRTESSGRWVVEGRQILSNSSGPLNIQYIKKITDPNDFDATLVKAIAARLAHVIAFPVTGETTLIGTMWDLYRVQIIEARSVDGQEDSGEDVEAGWLLEGRAVGISDPFGQGVEDI